VDKPAAGQRNPDPGQRADSPRRRGAPKGAHIGVAFGVPGAPVIVGTQFEALLSFGFCGEPVSAQVAKDIVAKYSAAHGNENSRRHRSIADLQNRKLLLDYWQEPYTAIRGPRFAEIRRGMGDA